MCVLFLLADNFLHVNMPRVTYKVFTTKSKLIRLTKLLLSVVAVRRVQQNQIAIGQVDSIILWIMN